MFLCYVCKRLLYPVFSVSEKHSVPIHDGEGNEGKSIVIHVSHFPCKFCVLLDFHWFIYLSFSLSSNPSDILNMKKLNKFQDYITINLLCFQTLSRVIATIVHFSDEQTKRIISYEDAKNTVRTEDMVWTSFTPSVN